MVKREQRRRILVWSTSIHKINGTEVFTCQADLSGKEVIEEYYINFGATLETVPGENVWLNQNLICSGRDKNWSYLYRYPWKSAERNFQYFCNRCLFSKYEFELIEDSYDKNAVEYVNIKDNTLTIKAKDVQDQEIFVGVRVISKDKDDEKNPLWSAETQIYVQAVREYSTQIWLKELIDTKTKNEVISGKLLLMS